MLAPVASFRKASIESRKIQKVAMCACTMWMVRCMKSHEEFNLEEQSTILIVVDRIVVSDRVVHVYSIRLGSPSFSGRLCVVGVIGGKNISSANTILVQFVDLQWASGSPSLLINAPFGRLSVTVLGSAEVDWVNRSR